MSNVRQATADDGVELVRMMEAMHAESAYSVVTLDRDRLSHFLRSIRENPNQCVLVYESSQGTLDGFYVGYVNSYFFSSELGAWDLLFYVRPETRGSIVAARLWQAFRNWAKDAGAKTIWPGVSTGITPKRTARFYEGMGLKSVGTVFFGELT